MKLYTTRMLKGDLTLTTKDFIDRPLQPGNIIEIPDAGHDQYYVVCQIFKNRKMTVRQLMTEQTRGGDIHYLGPADRLTPEDVVFVRDSV